MGRRMTSAEKPASNRYEFGAYWASFIDKSYSAERRQAAAGKLLSFLGKDRTETRRYAAGRLRSLRSRRNFRPS